MKKMYNVLPAPFTLISSLQAILFIILCSSLSVFAEGNTHMIPIPLEERVRQASLIVEGEVISQKSFWDAGHKNIYTSSIIKVYKVFKGELKEQQVELITQGGAVGLDIHVVSSSLKLHPGQQGSFFLNSQKTLSNTPGKDLQSTEAYGSQQGLIAYDIRHNSAADAFQRFNTIESVYKAITAQTKTAFRVLTQNEKLLQAAASKNQQLDALSAPAITSFSPTVTSAGTGTVLTINGSGFGNTRGNGSVEFKNADDGGATYTKPFPREYISWSNTQIRLLIPSSGQDQGTPGSGTIRVTANDGNSVVSTTAITLEYAYSSISVADAPVNKNRTFAPKLIDNDNTGGYTIQFAPSMQNNIPAQYGFQRALTSWICNTGVNWKIGEPITQETTEDDDRNVIRFAPGSVVGDRVLARTNSRYVGYKCNNDTIFFLSEFDMEINSGINWQYGPGPPGGGQYDFETVMLHELGHAHQLGHIIRPREAIMHYSVESNRTYRDLSAADIEGGNFVMSQSTTQSACINQSPIIPIPRDECNIFANISNQDVRYSQTSSIEIRWTSTNEEGVDYYVVQRSSDGINYTDIGTIDAKGNNSNYIFEDTEPLPLRSYYRIMAVYTNDASRFSTRMVITDPESLNRVYIGPNPVNEQGRTTILYLTETTITINYQLYDVTGKIVVSGSATFNDSVTGKTLDLSRMASGIYLLKWTVRGTTGTEKIIKH